MFTREEVYANVMKHYQVETLDEFYAMIGYGGIFHFEKYFRESKTIIQNLSRHSAKRQLPDSPTLKTEKKKRSTALLLRV